jgi:hypothetical protein
MVELTLKDVTWTEEMTNDKEAQQNSIGKYSTMVKLFT